MKAPKKRIIFKISYRWTALRSGMNWKQSILLMQVWKRFQLVHIRGRCNFGCVGRSSGSKPWWQVLDRFGSNPSTLDRHHLRWLGFWSSCLFFAHFPLPSVFCALPNFFLLVCFLHIVVVVVLPMPWVLSSCRCCCCLANCWRRCVWWTLPWLGATSAIGVAPVPARRVLGEVKP
jgi:hypothetical protein